MLWNLRNDVVDFDKRAVRDKLKESDIGQADIERLKRRRTHAGNIHTLAVSILKERHEGNKVEGWIYRLKAREVHPKNVKRLRVDSTHHDHFGAWSQELIGSLGTDLEQKIRVRESESIRYEKMARSWRQSFEINRQTVSNSRSGETRDQQNECNDVLYHWASLGNVSKRLKNKSVRRLMSKGEPAIRHRELPYFES